MKGSMHLLIPQEWLWTWVVIFRAHVFIVWIVIDNLFKLCVSICFIMELCNLTLIEDIWGHLIGGFRGFPLGALFEDIWGHLPLVLIISCYIFCIAIKHLKLLYVLQTIIVWKEFELDTCFNFNLWNVWIDFFINVLLK